MIALQKPFFGLITRNTISAIVLREGTSFLTQSTSRPLPLHQYLWGLQAFVGEPQSVATKNSGLRSILPKGKNSMAPANEIMVDFSIISTKQTFLQWNHTLRQNSRPTILPLCPHHLLKLKDPRRKDTGRQKE